jgi:hypothetical protein
MSFTVMCELTQRPLLSALYAMNVPMVVQHMRVFEQLFSKHLPRVFENFRNLGTKLINTIIWQFRKKVIVYILKNP